MNPFMKMLLRSPLHGLLSGTLMLMTYTGPKTGKQHTIPIGYFAWDQGELMAYSSGRWWRYVGDGRRVTLLVKGQRLEAVPTVIHEREAVIDTLQEFGKRLGWKTARMLRIGIPTDRQPTLDDLRAIPAGRTFIHFKIVERQGD